MNTQELPPGKGLFLLQNGTSRAGQEHTAAETKGPGLVLTWGFGRENTHRNLECQLISARGVDRGKGAKGGGHKILDPESNLKNGSDSPPTPRGRKEVPE